MANWMPPLDSNTLRSIEALCRAYGVARLELFGSATGGDFDPDRSDIDLLVEFAPSRTLGPWLSDYFTLKAKLEALLGRPVDLVMSGAMKQQRFIEAVGQQRRVLYAA